MSKAMRLRTVGLRALVVFGLVAVQAQQGASVALAQAAAQDAGVVAARLQEDKALERYVDSASGMTVEQAVRYALENNGELLAVRKEVDAARAMVRQASLRANPALEVGGAKQINGSDNSVMVEGMLPLELGGRRAARVLVAEREVEMREQMLADRERMLAA